MRAASPRSPHSKQRGLISTDWSTGRPSQIEVWPPIPYTIQLSPSDCNTTSGPINCTEACRNETFLFTPTSLRIFSLLAAASVLVRNDNYSFDPTDDSARRVAQYWHVPDMETFGVERVLGNIIECISQSCVAASGVGICGDAVSRVRYVPINAANLSSVVEILSHYCNGLSSITNADMAGPGVSTADLIAGFA